MRWTLGATAQRRRDNEVESAGAEKTGTVARLRCASRFSVSWQRLSGEQARRYHPLSLPSKSGESPLDRRMVMQSVLPGDYWRSLFLTWWVNSTLPPPRSFPSRTPPRRPIPRSKCLAITRGRNSRHSLSLARARALSDSESLINFFARLQSRTLSLG